MLGNDSLAVVVLFGGIGALTVAVSMLLSFKRAASAKARWRRRAVLGSALALGAAGVAFGWNRLSNEPGSQRRESASSPARSDEWRLRSLDSGKLVLLSSFEGKVVFLNLWATWCPPCVAEMPGIQALVDEFEGVEDVAFVMVSEDRDDASVERFLRENEYSFLAYFPAGSPPPRLFTTAIPFTFILDKKGKVRFRHLGPADWSQDSVVQFINRLLAEPGSTERANAKKGADPAGRRSAKTLTAGTE